MIGRVFRIGWNFTFLPLLAVFIVSGASLSAEPIPVKVLQFQQDRLYFNAGTENLIFENAPFTILNGGDTLYADFIERSDLGISYSRPTDISFDSIPFDSLTALIRPARVDSLTEISLATSHFRPSLIQGKFSSSPMVSSFDDLLLEQPTIRNQRVTVRMLKQPLDPLLSSGRPIASALFTLSPPSLPTLISNQSTAAPFIAVLLPNLNRPVNKNGLLTTSIYYRYNEQHLPQIFAGRTTPFNLLYAHNEPEERLYKYDSRQAARLFDRIRFKPKRLTIAITDPALESIGKYFADILARDRVMVDFATGWKTDADLYLTFVELRASDPTHSLVAIADLLELAKSTDRLHTETLAQIDDKLESYYASADSSFHKRVLRQIDRMMQEDLGAFPLFRPTLYYAHEAATLGMRFNDEHLPEFDQLVNVILPPPPSLKGASER